MNRNHLVTTFAVALLVTLAWLTPRLGSDDGATVQGGVRYDTAGIAIGGIEPNPRGGTPLNIDNILAHRDKAVVVSLDGADTFTVPGPEDPEWADYLQFRRHFRSALDNSPGFAVAYDPEWRAAVKGVREAPEPGLKLFGGRSSIRDLAAEVLAETMAKNQLGMVDLAIRKEEFEVICWPSFPQSRPYMRVPWTEAWGFQYANLLGGSREGFRQVDDRDLELVDVTVGSTRSYNGWFTLHSEVRLVTRDVATGERVELTYLDSVIEQDGDFKVFLYKD